MNSDSIDLYRPKMPNTFGTASWASMKDLRQHEMLEVVKGKNMGPLIGMLTPAEIGGRDVHYVYAPGEGHALTLAPTRAGKGRGQIIPNLLCYPGSAMVLDIKGENFERTAGWRSANGHRVIRFAPFEAGSATWNPIDHIAYGCNDGPNDPVRQENASYLSDLMITPMNTEDQYWDAAARSLVQGVMMFVATAPIDGPIQVNDKVSVRVRERTMAEVRRLLVEQDPISFKHMLAAMAQSPESLVRETAGTMLHMEAAREQNSGVKTILMEHTKVWGFERVKAVTGKTSFQFRELRDERPTTIYIVIPFDQLKDYRAVLRVLIGWCMREVRQTWSRLVDEKRPPVAFFLDEFPQLGYMQPIEDALAYIGSYAVKFWFFVQELSQLQKHYKDTWRSFIGNCGMRCFFGISDLETAKLISEMSGSSTVRNRSYQASANESDTVSDSTTAGSSRSSGWSGLAYNSSSGSSSGRTFTTSRTTGSSFGATLGYIGRPLFMPDEVLRMPFGSMIALPRGMPAIRGQLRFWDEDIEGFRPRGMVPPPVSGNPDEEPKKRDSL